MSRKTSLFGMLASFLSLCALCLAASICALPAPQADAYDPTPLNLANAEDDEEGPTAHSITIRGGERGLHGTATVDKHDAVAGEKVSITAVPDEGCYVKYIQVEYKTSSDPYSTWLQLPVDENGAFTMPDANVTVDVEYEKGTYKVSVLPGEHGNVSILKSRYNEGDWVDIGCAPASGYMPGKIVVTTASGTEIPVRISDSSYRVLHYPDPIPGEVNDWYEFEMPAEEVTVSATFEQAQYYKVNVEVEGEGKVSPFPPGKSAYPGQVVKLAGNGAQGWKLAYWEVVSPDGLELKDAEAFPMIGSSDFPDEMKGFVMPDGPVSIRAVFEEKTEDECRFDVKTSSTGSGTIEVHADTYADGKVKEGDRVTVEAVPDPGWKLKWITCYKGPSPIGSQIGTSEKFVMPEGDVVVDAVFEKEPAPIQPNIIVLLSDLREVLLLIAAVALVLAAVVLVSRRFRR